MGPDRGLLPGADQLIDFWAPIEARTVIRAAWLGTVWVVVAVVIGAVVVAAVALIAAAVAAVMSIFDTEVSLSAVTRRSALVGGGIAAAGAVVASTWAAAYSSTRSGSRWRLLAGSAVGVALGLGLIGIGSLGAPAAALAGGWGMAIPSDRVGRAGLRSLPLALAALLPPFRAGGGWVEWLIAGVAGVLAALLWTALAEGLWASARRFSSRSSRDPAIMQSKTQDSIEGESAEV